jgi:hypothetical protein
MSEADSKPGYIRCSCILRSPWSRSPRSQREIVSMTTRFPGFHTVAVANIRAGAAFAVARVGAGSLLASSRIAEASQGLAWHLWLGLAAAVATTPSERSRRRPGITSDRLYSNR